MKDYSAVTNPWKEWKIVKQIGRGSFGRVYEIERDTYGFKETAALKVISVPASENDLETLRNSNYDISKWCRSIINDIFREYALMAQLKFCPNIVRCDDCKEIPHEEDEGSDVCIRMELLTPLSKMRRAFSEEEVIAIGKDICSALIACGEKNIIHRDIKPDNILVSDKGVYKLGDFGVAREMDHTAAASLKGTPTFMAPEVEARREYGKDADTYSLGLVMYWLLNRRRHPFEPIDDTPTAEEVHASNIRRLQGDALPAPADGSRELRDIVLKACSYSRADRFSSPREMYDALCSIGKALQKPEEPVVHDEISEAPVMVPEPDPLDESIDNETLPMDFVSQSDAASASIPEESSVHEHMSEAPVMVPEPDPLDESIDDETLPMDVISQDDAQEEVPHAQIASEVIPEEPSLHEEAAAPVIPDIKKELKPAAAEKPAPEKKGKKGLMIGVVAAVAIAAVVGFLALGGGKSGDEKMYNYIEQIVSECNQIDDDGYPAKDGMSYIKYAIDDFNGDGKKDCWIYSYDWFESENITGDEDYLRGKMQLIIQGDRVPNDNTWYTAQRKGTWEIDTEQLRFYDDGIIVDQYEVGGTPYTQVIFFSAYEPNLNHEQVAEVCNQFSWFVCDSLLFTTARESDQVTASIVPIDSIVGIDEEERLNVSKEEAQQVLSDLLGDPQKVNHIYPEIHDFADELESLGGVSDDI